MNTNQLEISFDTARPSPSRARREVKRSTAQWWFAQMRLIVDRAFDWQTAPSVRPEQTYLTLSARQ